jgi:hypothetical protein
MSKILIIQGPLSYLNSLKNCYRDDVIISTWEDEICESSSFSKIVKSSYPTIAGNKNCNLQFKSTYEGCVLAKKLGYTQVIKIRSDILIPEYERLLDLLDLSKLNFFSFHNWDGGYYGDYIIGGPIDEMLLLFEKFDYVENIPPEKMLLSRLKYTPNSVLKVLIEHNIDCYSLKWQKNLTESCKSDPLFLY